jgi:abortive infection AbiH-like protein
MVMGVNDISQITNPSFHKNQDIIEALVKNRCNQAIKHTVDENCKKQISNANLICIFGSSLGEIDNMWWKLIAKSLAKNCILIIFSKGDEIPLRINYKMGREERKIRNNFQDISTMTEELRKITGNKIYASINSTIFDINKE